MKIAVDITHPAHFHFFKNAIAEWERHGHDVLILSRDKDLTLRLLDEAGLDHHCLTRVRKGIAGLAFEMVEHSLGVWRALSRHHSHVVAAIGGTFIVHPARLRRIPALVFYDTENAKLSNRITYPYATRIYTPRAYLDDLGPKQVRYNGYHELAYLHPQRFKPDPSKLVNEGLEVGEPFTLIRLVSWQSHHDVGDYGIQNIGHVIHTLSHYGRVLISSESRLPDDLQQYACRGKASDIHHVLSFASLFFGESATMASEAAMLGIPSVFLSTSRRGYTDEQERLYQMVFNFNGVNAIEELALQRAEAILMDPHARHIFQERRLQMLADLIDVTSFVVDVVEEYAQNTQGGI